MASTPALSRIRKAAAPRAGGAGAGGTSGGAGAQAAGAGGLVQSTLGLGAPVSSYDPQVISKLSLQHSTKPLSNLQEYGVPSLRFNTATVNGSLLQAFATGTSFEFDFFNNRQTINSPYVALTPALNTQWVFTVQQQLLAGFGLGPNLRYLHIAKNNKKISDLAFKNQVIVTVSQIEEIYWDLVNAYQDEQVKTRSRDFAQKTLDDTRKQFDLQAVAVHRGNAGPIGGSESRPGSDRGKNQSAIRGIADQGCAHQEPGRPDTGGDAGGSDRFGGKSRLRRASRQSRN